MRQEFPDCRHGTYTDLLGVAETGRLRELTVIAQVRAVRTTLT